MGRASLRGSTNKSAEVNNRVNEDEIGRIQLRVSKKMRDDLVHSLARAEQGGTGNLDPARGFREIFECPSFGFGTV